MRVQTKLLAAFLAIVALLIALGAVGLGAWAGHLDTVLLPSLVLFIAVAAYRSRVACRRTP